MSTEETGPEADDPAVVPFPATAAAKRQPSSVEKIWGRPVVSLGYAAIPSILIQAQKRIGITPTQMNIIVQLLDYWHEPSRRPFPPKREIAKRIGITEKTVQNNIRALEKAGLIRREIRKTAAGDYNTNVYHLDGLVSKVQALEPDFAEARRKRAEARTAAETPAGLRSA
ncbi:hypothetical protein AA309_12000 [Microvirga vignae]|uniref:Helix-turn-helix domain-containing protein n=1 Tax=Microvirga vignae TaxID=1225564 RepID=A0A0H1RJR4_9HYPH|nr:helix-turn-helix domain-containing protein [Microvirga vignae]KLK92842.1 hypothetical protein AA309_12000 [Microvirga vignae]